ncbi:hypothetical protein DPMN_013165 [Dreissena polymorpha]|uniref:EF-hand domain-containing protein n=1 Tax=Dreissena polymorpha TaxID=45954 RepID=A0A9D4N6W1_DREPO|nr:hypothetical protein DPMN_013165 [Dreissena polymorpha]
MKLFTLSLEVDRCNFNLYDVDRDDVITKEELVAVFGDNKNTKELFGALDMLSGELLCTRISHHNSITVISCTSFSITWQT